jgi:hypothetical protein
VILTTQSWTGAILRLPTRAIKLVFNLFRYKDDRLGEGLFDPRAKSCYQF